jgi:hypothetical protein
LLTLLVVALLSFSVGTVDLELTQFISANGLPYFIIDIALMALLLLPYFLTHRPGSVFLAVLLAYFLDASPSIGITWLVYSLAAESVFFMSWWRNRGLYTGALAAAAGPIVAVLIGNGSLEITTFPDVLTLAFGGIVAAFIGNLIGFVTGIGR